MHIDTHKLVRFHHPLADISIKPANDIHTEILKTLIQLALDSYQESRCFSAESIHNEAKVRNAENYQTPGYYLKLYRIRANLTQTKLANKIGIGQHHLSEMEHNKRTIGKKMAKVLAEILNSDYRKLL